MLSPESKESSSYASESSASQASSSSPLSPATFSSSSSFPSPSKVSQASSHTHALSSSAGDGNPSGHQNERGASGAVKAGEGVDRDAADLAVAPVWQMDNAQPDCSVSVPSPLPPNPSQARISNEGEHHAATSFHSFFSPKLFISFLPFSSASFPAHCTLPSLTFSLFPSQICHVKFTMIRRRHHCRACGALVCGSCSPAKRVLPNISSKPVRSVCNKHYNV